MDSTIAVAVDEFKRNLSLATPTLSSPITSKGELGELVPIPTFPLELMRTRSLAPADKTMSLATAPMVTYVSPLVPLALKPISPALFAAPSKIATVCEDVSLTCNNLVGEVVPMPTRPLESMRIASEVPLVSNDIALVAWLNKIRPPVPSGSLK